MQNFPRHLHEEYVLGVMVNGVEVLHHRGVRYLVPAGSILMINAGEWHANHSVDDRGFGYRTIYPSIELLKHFARMVTSREREIFWVAPPVANGDIRLRYLLLKLHSQNLAID
jgi:hypothetical protein